jgi:DNA (cytosine-5)-methyltransferase 1
VGKDEGIKLLRREIAAINRRHGTSYLLQVLSLNTADYGVPQVSERVFLVAAINGQQLQLPLPMYGESDRLEPYRTAWDEIGDLDRDTWPSELDLKGRWANLLPSIPEGRNYLWHTPRNAANGGEPLFGHADQMKRTIR